MDDKKAEKKALDLIAVLKGIARDTQDVSDQLSILGETARKLSKSTTVVKPMPVGFTARLTAGLTLQHRRLLEGEMHRLGLTHNQLAELATNYLRDTGAAVPDLELSAQAGHGISIKAPGHPKREVLVNTSTSRAYPRQQAQGGVGSLYPYKGQQKPVRYSFRKAQQVEQWKREVPSLPPGWLWNTNVGGIFFVYGPHPDTRPEASGDVNGGAIETAYFKGGWEHNATWGDGDRPNPNTPDTSTSLLLSALASHLGELPGDNWPEFLEKQAGLLEGHARAYRVMADLVRSQKNGADPQGE